MENLGQDDLGDGRAGARKGVVVRSMAEGGGGKSQEVLEFRSQYASAAWTGLEHVLLWAETAVVLRSSPNYNVSL